MNLKTSTPLPSDLQIAARFAQQPNVISAYAVCIEFEQYAQHIQRSNPTSEAIIRARVLGFLILNAPSSQARSEMVRVIQSCERDFHALDALGDAFIQWFICPFRKCKGRTPVISSHSSRSSFDRAKGVLKLKIRETPQTHSEAKELALLRDGYRCLVTGKYDAGPTARDKVDITRVLESGGAINTECAYIVPESTFFRVGNSNNAVDNEVQVERDYSASVLAVLECCGYNVSRLNGGNIHSLYNIMTLDKNHRDWFDRLALCFEATEIPNAYNVVTFDPWIVPGQRVVTFSTTDPERLPLPSPDLLALHAACAKVAHLSGAAEMLDQYDRAVERLSVLDQSGASFDVLMYVLRGASVPGAISAPRQ